MKSVSRKAKKVDGYKQTKLGLIPIEWEYTELVTFAELYKKKIDPLKTEINYKCVELEHLDQETGRINGFTNIVEQKSIKNKFETGNVLFGKLRPYLRKFWLAEFEGVCSSEVWVMNGIKNRCINQFLFYLVQHHWFLQAASVSTGTKMPRADWNFVSEFPFPLPSISEQQKIARILSTWDKAIEKTEQLIAQKQQLKKGLMQQLLTGKVRFKEFVKSKKMKKTKLGLIPEEWEIKTIADVAKIHVGRDLKEDSFSTSENSVFKFPVFSNTVDNYGFYGYYNFMEYKGDSVTIVGRGVGLGTAFTRTGGYGAIGRLLVLFPKKELSANFLTEYANNRMNFFHESSGIPQLTGEQVANYEIVIPSLLEQERISTSLKISDKEINLLKDKLSKLKIQKKGLMQQLLTGKVRVKVN